MTERRDTPPPDPRAPTPGPGGARPELALDLDPSAVGLYLRAPGGDWALIGRARLDAEDFSAEIAALRHEAEQRTGARPAPVALWLPPEQVLIRHARLGLGLGDPLSRAAAHVARTSPHRRDELALAVSPPGPDGQATILATFAQTHREALDYCRRWGFEPAGSVSTRVAVSAFGATPPVFRIPPARAARRGPWLGRATGLAAALAAVGLWWLAGPPASKPPADPGVVAPDLVRLARPGLETAPDRPAAPGGDPAAPARPERLAGPLAPPAGPRRAAGAPDRPSGRAAPQRPRSAVRDAAPRAPAPAAAVTGLRRAGAAPAPGPAPALPSRPAAHAAVSAPRPAPAAEVALGPGAEDRSAPAVAPAEPRPRAPGAAPRQPTPGAGPGGHPGGQGLSRARAGLERIRRTASQAGLPEPAIAAAPPAALSPPPGSGLGLVPKTPTDRLPPPGAAILAVGLSAPPARPGPVRLRPIRAALARVHAAAQLAALAEPKIAAAPPPAPAAPGAGAVLPRATRSPARAAVVAVAALRRAPERPQAAPGPGPAPAAPPPAPPASASAPAGAAATPAAMARAAPLPPPRPGSAAPEPGPAAAGPIGAGAALPVPLPPRRPDPAGAEPATDIAAGAEPAPRIAAGAEPAPRIAAGAEPAPRIAAAPPGTGAAADPGTGAAAFPLPPRRPEDRAPAAARVARVDPAVSAPSDAPGPSLPLPPERPADLATRSTRPGLVPAPSVDPAPGDVQAVATQTGLAIDKTSLIGIIQLDSARQALLRLPGGEVRRVAKGDLLEGWRVSLIGRAALRLTREGETLTLLLVGPE